ncbi:MAG: AbrB/MazE/SpoVT family DNA-binding domain-containing protein [Oscillospiraceae bacterium]|nr:AbrB/MazE/SpoVT family DNA-binding domain-containing protein [Oscillospiraceae bacterium]
MKATGIVRRIDDLGRVVIPKEIRRTMRIREGDPLEIYTSGEGEVIFKKYSPVGEMQDSAESAADVIHKLGSAPVVIFDRDHVVATAGVQKKEYAERRISQGLEELLETRKSWVYDTEGKAILPVEGVGRSALAVSPIIASGDIAGAVCFLNSENQTKGSELQLTLAQTAAMFLGKQLEA